MIKLADDNQEIDSLITQLTGSSAPTSVSSESSSNEYYSLPVKVGQNNQPISKTNKPWVVGTFIPGQYVNERHPDGHPAVDLRAPKGTPIYPIGQGIVSEVKPNPKGGNTCKVSHENGGVVSYYAHMDTVNATVGQQVKSNTILGTVGTTGSAVGGPPHVHYSVKIDGKSVDPFSINGKKVGTLSKAAIKTAATKQDIKKINFPKSEHKDIKKRLKSKGYIFTTRIQNELKKYKKGMIVETPWKQLLKITSIKQIDKLEDHPFYDKLTSAQRNLLDGKKMNILKLEEVDEDKKTASLFATLEKYSIKQNPKENKICAKVIDQFLSTTLGQDIMNEFGSATIEQVGIYVKALKEKLTNEPNISKSGAINYIKDLVKNG